jgi:hypothetical protein
LRTCKFTNSVPVNPNKNTTATQKPSNVNWKENEELVLRNRGGVFPGNERKQPACCARKQRNSTTGGTTHTSVLSSHGHGARGPTVPGSVCRTAVLSDSLIHPATDRLSEWTFTDPFADRVSEWNIQKLLQSLAA